ncbi:MAG: MATE family efflux transporter [Acidobacteriota bacterium]|nr:MAG: MATE family efflux transporter [Acidobacteriota bacterium]
MLSPPDALPPLTTRTLLHIAIPSALFTVLTNGYRVVDQYFIQTVSTASQAAIGSSIFVLIFFYAAFELIAAGTGPLVARATGGGDPEKRRAILGTSLAGACVLTLIVMFVGIGGASLITASLGLSGETAVECKRYLQTLSWTILPLVLTPVIDQGFIAMGNARAPMVLHGLSLALNIVLTPLLIHTAGLGIVGAALASNASRAVATALGLWLLTRTTGLRLTDVRITSELKRVLKIGFPMAMGVAAYALVYWAMLKTSISPLGPHVNAALGIGFSALEGVSWPLFHGLALAVASLVGRYLGAGRPDLARGTVRLALPITIAGGVVASLTFWLGGAYLTGLFTSEAAVHAAATEYAVILAASQLFVALESLTEGVLAGAGDTRTVFLYSAPINALRIPLAWLFAFPLGMGAAGIWWVVNITTYFKALGKGYAVWRGKWAELDP